MALHGSSAGMTSTATAALGIYCRSACRNEACGGCSAVPRAVPAATCTENIIDSCRFSRVLHDPAVPPAERLTRAVYTDAKRQQTTLNHFHEKLLHIKVLLNA